MCGQRTPRASSVPPTISGREAHATHVRCSPSVTRRLTCSSDHLRAAALRATWWFHKTFPVSWSARSARRARTRPAASVAPAEMVRGPLPQALRPPRVCATSALTHPRRATPNAWTERAPESVLARQLPAPSACQDTSRRRTRRLETARTVPPAPRAATSRRLERLPVIIARSTSGMNFFGRRASTSVSASQALLALPDQTKREPRTRLLVKHARPATTRTGSASSSVCRARSVDTTLTCNPICHYCIDETADSEAWLRAIAPDIAAGVADNSTRMVLESNTTVRAAAVSVLECVCEVGQEPRAVGDFSRCRQCMQGSFQEHKRHEHCTYCGGLSVDHGHSLLHHYGLSGTGVTDSTHCAACPAFSGQNETLVGPGKIRMNDVSECLCFPGHERVLSELASECRNCSQYMIKTTLSDDACTFCPAGHFFIDRHIPCQLCDLPEDGGERHVGLVLNMHDISLPWGTSEDDCICRPGFERAFDSQCTPCPTGKFRGSNLTRLCTACPQDTFQDSLAQVSCLSCPQNSSTLSLYGSSTVRDCVCGPGFQPLSLLDSHTGVCQPCAAGTFRTSRMQNESEESCISCPEDHYCPLGSTTPVSCPHGEVSDAGSRTPDDCQCPPGFGRESYASNFNANESYVNVSRHNGSRPGVCTLCARGFFADTRSNDACLVCPENKTTTSPGASNQTACTCVSGHGVDTMLPSAPCTPCLSGSFAAGGSNEQCKPCGWGTRTAPFAVPESGDTCMCNANLGVRLQTI
jgi:hypothetical protein